MKHAWKILLAIIALVLVAACAQTPPAEERKLTKEQDAEFAERCANGCAIVPLPIWREIQKMLRGQAT